jgi:hypothetical protein
VTLGAPTWSAVSKQNTEYGILRALLLLGAWGARLVEFRRLEDRIRELCTQAVVTTESAELTEVIRQLREALREHAKRLRQLAAAKPPHPERRDHPSERRRTADEI